MGSAPRMGRAQRREQLLETATRAFASTGGFASTNLDDIAREAGVTRAIVYRHFESKAELYQAAIDRAVAALHHAATADAEGELNAASLRRMVVWAAAEPAAFRLLFRYAAREPEFSAEVETIWTSMVAHARPQLASVASSAEWAEWGARMSTTMVVESIMAWLDTGRPDPEEAVARIERAAAGIAEAVRAP